MVAWREIAAHLPLSSEALNYARTRTSRVVVKVLKDEVSHLAEPAKVLERPSRRLVYAVYEDCRLRDFVLGKRSTHRLAPRSM